MRAQPDAADAVRLGQDWVTIWQSELAAIAVDREQQETWHLMLGIWAAAAAAMLRPAPRLERAREPRAASDGTARAAAAAGATTAAVAPDAGRDEVERLHRRIAELEQRLVAVEQSAIPAAAARKRRRG